MNFDSCSGKRMENMSAIERHAHVEIWHLADSIVPEDCDLTAEDIRAFGNTLADIRNLPAFLPF